MLSRLTQEILDTCAKHNITLLSSHLPGLANTTSVALSRQKSQDEWYLSPIVTRKIFAKLGCPEVDLFASKDTAQVNPYFTLDRTDKEALGVDALAQSWDFSLMYAFPPPALLLTTLQKFRKLGGKLLLIAPHWPDAPWFAELSSLLYCQPLRLRYRTNLVINQTTGCSLSSLNRLRLTVWPLSRPYCNAPVSPRTSLNSSLRLGGGQQESNTDRSGAPGLHGVRLKGWTQLPFI